MTMSTTSVYSVRVFDPHITATWLGADVPYYKLNETYPSLDDMPYWAKHKMSVLFTIDPDDKPTPVVPLVGRRINRYIFWLTDDPLEDTDESTV